MKNRPTVANGIFQNIGKLLWKGIRNIFDIVILLALIGGLIGVFFIITPLGVYSLFGVLTQGLVTRTTISLQFWVLLIYFALIVLFVRDFISEDRLRRMMRIDYKHILGPYYSLTFPILFIAFSLPYFSGLSCTLKTINLIRTVPNFTVNDNCVGRFGLFYIWHILDSIPLLKIPQTILWSVPHEYHDSLSGLILLIFKVIIVFPVIKAYLVWRKVRSEDEIDKKSDLDDSLKTKSQIDTSKA